MKHRTLKLIAEKDGRITKFYLVFMSETAPHSSVSCSGGAPKIRLSSSAAHALIGPGPMYLAPDNWAAISVTLP